MTEIYTLILTLIAVRAVFRATEGRNIPPWKLSG